MGIANERYSAPISLSVNVIKYTKVLALKQKFITTEPYPRPGFFCCCCPFGPGCVCVCVCVWGGGGVWGGSPS